MGQGHVCQVTKLSITGCLDGLGSLLQHIVTGRHVGPAGRGAASQGAARKGKLTASGMVRLRLRQGSVWPSSGRALRQWGLQCLKRSPLAKVSESRAGTPGLAQNELAGVLAHMWYICGNWQGLWHMRVVRVREA